MTLFTRQLLTHGLTVVYSIVDYRGYTSPTSQQILVAGNNDISHREYTAVSSPEDNNLDPVSALLKAGESSYSQFPSQ